MGNGDPLNFIDPSGERSLAQQMVVGSIITVIGNLGVNYIMKTFFQEFYAALGETVFPDALIIGFSGDILPFKIPSFVEAIFSLIPGVQDKLVNPTGSIITGPELVFSTTSAEIALFGVLGGIAKTPGNLLRTGSLYWGYVWNLYNTKEYKGPFVSIGIGNTAVFCSPSSFIFGPWGIARSATVYGPEGSPKSASVTKYWRIHNQPFDFECEVHFFSMEALIHVQLLVQVLNKHISPVAYFANMSFWWQAGDAKEFWNKYSGHSVKKRQQAEKRPEGFQSGPGLLFFGRFLD